MSERPPWFRRAIAPGLVPGRASRAEMDEEIASHIEMRVADLVAAGMTPEDARAEAERRFGNLDESRRMLRAGARRRDGVRRQRDRLGALLGDLRFAWRQMRRAPLFSAVAVATLAVGIGLTTAMFALVDHVLLRPLPFVAPDRLVTLSSIDSLGNDFPQVSSSNWQDWRSATRFIESSAIHLERGMDLRTDQGAIRVPGALVSGAFFEVLRPRFIAGRPFTAADVDAGATAVVISERLWRTVQGAQPTLSAPLQTLAGDWRIAGVVAAGQEYPPGTDVWHPTTIASPQAGTRNNVNWEAVARLRPEATPEQAEEELASIAQRIRDSDPSALYSYGVEVHPLKARILGDAEGYLTLLLGAVAFVLLIACANVAAANLARATRRSHEMGIRAAIGAGRGRIVQQLLIEHVLLAAIAGTLGVALGWSALRVGVSLWGARVPRAVDAVLDARVLAVAAGITLLAAVLSGTLPALVASRRSLSALLATGSRGSARGAGPVTGRALVAAQIAIAVVLVSGSALTIRSFRALISRDLGYDVNVATVEAALVAPGLRDDPARQYAYWDALRASLASIPGVTSVGVANWTPMGGAGTSFIDVEGSDQPNSGAGFRVASDGYVEAIGVPLIAGRLIAEADDSGSTPITVVNRVMAERFWPGESPVGKRVRATSMEDFGQGRAPWRTVVGVVGDVRHGGFDSEIRPEMYVPHRQVAPYWITSMTAVVRSDLPIERVIPVIQQRARAVDPRVAVEIGSLEQRAAARVAPQRMTMSLLGFFGAVSLLLASLGIYGLLSYVAANRTREMAIRAALGATRGKLVALIVVGASGLVVVGITAGLAAALAMARVLESRLVDIARVDPVAFASGAAVIAGTALLAALVPAVRASSADPADALRAE